MISTIFRNTWHVSERRASLFPIELVVGEFWEWSNGLSQGKASKDSKPLVEEVCMVEFRVGAATMYFKRSFNGFKCTDFIVKKYMIVVNEKTFMSSQTPHRASWSRLWSKTGYSRQTRSPFAHRPKLFLGQSVACVEAVNFYSLYL